MIHEHSKLAYHSELPKLSRRAARILDWIEANPKVTDRDVMLGLGYTDMNSVRPRITEAVEIGSLVEVGERTCLVTGKTVRIVDLSLAERGRREAREQREAA